MTTLSTVTHALTSVRPILFSASMIRAIQSGAKSQTRRIYKPRAPAPYEILDELDDGAPRPFVMDAAGQCHPIRCPYGVIGDLLRVRETYAFERQHDEWKPSEIPDGERVWFLADGPKPTWTGKTRPAIFLPTWASRIHLRVTGVRVERLQSISEGDAKAEGIAPELQWEMKRTGSKPWESMRDGYASLWSLINPDQPWCADPFVWVVSFEPAERTEASR